MLSELIEHEDNFISVSMKSEEDICPEELPENIWTPKVWEEYLSFLLSIIINLCWVTSGRDVGHH